MNVLINIILEPDSPAEGEGVYVVNGVSFKMINVEGGPSSGTYRITLGGDYSSSAQLCRVSNRDHLNQNYSMHGIGLRLVLR